jgi:hypothetical protein
MCVKSFVCLFQIMPTQSIGPALAAMLLSSSAPQAEPCNPKSSVPCCNPTFTPPQLCPGGIPCEPCGGSTACECPSPPSPSPAPPQSDTRLTIVNGCHQPIWIAHIVGGGVGPDAQDVKIAPGGNSSFHTGLNGGGLSATRFWPKVGCDASGGHCKVGSSGGPAEACVIRAPGKPDDYSHCAPPVDPKFEATFAQGSAAKDVLDMSLVDGYTLPFTLEVHSGSCERHGQAFTGMDCSGLSLVSCPQVEALGGQNVSLHATDPKTGQPGGCYSPCMKLVDDKWNPNGTAVAPDSNLAGPYCCAGAWGTPDACNNDGAVLRTEYLKAVKEVCPAAYGYAYDDKTSTIACTTATRYTVTFHCPDWV